MLLRRLKKTASSAMRTVVDIDPGAVPCILGSVPDAKMVEQLKILGEHHDLSLGDYNKVGE